MLPRHGIPIPVSKHYLEQSVDFRHKVKQQTRSSDVFRRDGGRYAELEKLVFPGLAVQMMVPRVAEETSLHHCSMDYKLSLFHTIPNKLKCQTSNIDQPLYNPISDVQPRSLPTIFLELSQGAWWPTCSTTMFLYRFLKYCM